MNKPAFFLCLAGIFTAGAVSGGFVGARMARELAERRMAERSSLFNFQRLQERLNLTPEQGEKLRPLLKQAREEGKTLRRLAEEQSQALQERVRPAVEQVLTEAQREELKKLADELRQRHREQRERFLREQREREKSKS